MEVSIPKVIFEEVLKIIDRDPVLKQTFAQIVGQGFDTFRQQESFNNIATFQLLSFMRSNGFPHAGVIVGQSITMGAFGTIDYYLGCCSLLSEAIVDLIQYFPTLGFYIEAPQLSRKRQHLRLTFHVKDKEDVNVATNKEAVMCGVIKIINRLTHSEIWPERVIIPTTFKDKKVAIALAEFCRAEIDYGKDYVVVYHESVMDLKLPFANPKLAKTLKNELDEELRVLQSKNTVVDKVLDFFKSNDNLFNLSQSATADALYTSESSLKRSLASEGTSFSNIFTSYKKDRALKLVLDTDTKIESVANSLSYSDRASFERAFKSWFQFTPMQFRKMTQLIAIDAKKLKSGDVFSLPPASQTCQQVINLIHEENFTMGQLTEIIIQDPILTGKILGIANSAYYGGREVKDLHDAVSKVLGVEMVQNLAISLMASVELETDQCPEFDLFSYWVQALVSVEFAKLFGQCPSLENESESKYLVLASLMHNIGAYALVYLRPGQTNQFLKLLKGSNAAYHVGQQIDLQYKIFSVCSFSVASLLLSHWGLPKTLCHLVAQQESAILKKGKNSKTVQVLVNLTDYVRQLFREPKNEQQMNHRLKELCEILDKDETLMQQRIDLIVAKIPDIEAIARKITSEIRVVKATE